MPSLARVGPGLETDTRRKREQCMRTYLVDGRVIEQTIGICGDGTAPALGTSLGGLNLSQQCKRSGAGAAGLSREADR